jgi:hypothetical protein
MMYGMVEHEVSRQRRSDIRREVAAYRLESELRAGHGKERRSPEDLGRKLSWHALLLGKRLRVPHGADYHQAAENGGGPVS